MIENFTAHSAEFAGATEVGGDLWRIMVLARWLREEGARTYRRAIVADTRDIFFQRDPFAWIDEPSSIITRDVANDTKGFIFIVHNDPQVPWDNSMWSYSRARDLFGPIYVAWWERSFRLGGQKYSFILNSGVIGGTIAAMCDYYELNAMLLMATPVRNFGIDQAVAEASFFFALEFTQFPHTAVILSEGYGPVLHRLHLNLPDSEFRLNNKQDFVNCLGVPYALVHQLNWRPKLWEEHTKKLVEWADAKLAGLSPGL